MSSFVILAVAAIAGYATISYFSDTETSTGNTFTAGSLDLIVDIDGRDENPLDGPIFDLPDMKPGDKGEVTLSLKVDDNPACGFVNVNITQDIDNDCTEPEDDVEGAGENDCDTPGELNDEVQFIIFSDPDCDNVYEVGDNGNGSQVLTQGTLTEDRSYAIGDLPAMDVNQPHNNAKCYGIAYCFGTPSMGTPDVNGAVEMLCDGSANTNITQTDSFEGELIIRAEQKRNQYDAGCPLGDITNNS